MEAREALSVFTTAFATSSLKRCEYTPATHCLCNHRHAAVHKTCTQSRRLYPSKSRACFDVECSGRGSLRGAGHLQAHDALLQGAARQQPVHIDRPLLAQPMRPVHCLHTENAAVHPGSSMPFLGHTRNASPRMRTDWTTVAGGMLHNSYNWYSCLRQQPGARLWHCCRALQGCRGLSDLCMYAAAWRLLGAPE